MRTRPTFKKLILDDLKSQGFKVIVSKIHSIRYECYSGGDSVTVKAVGLDESEHQTLRAFLDQYEMGSLNGMIDLYEYKEKQTKPRTAKFVFLENERR